MSSSLTSPVNPEVEPMGEPGLATKVEGNRSSERVFCGVVQCLPCAARRVVDIRAGDLVVLRRDGTINLTCPHCGVWGLHRLVRIGL